MNEHRQTDYIQCLLQSNKYYICTYYMDYQGLLDRLWSKRGHGTVARDLVLTSYFSHGKTFISNHYSATA